MNQEITRWLPLIGAFMAGFFALFQIRSNNITNARIKWLENLKQTFTSFLSECTMLQMKEGLHKGINEKGPRENIPEATKNYQQKITESFLDHLTSISSKYDLIKLNLNPKEELHQKLEKLLDDYMLLFNQMPVQKTYAAHTRLGLKLEAHSDTIILLIRYIMKLEWEKTKRSYLSRKWYMKRGPGKKILSESLQLSLLPERKPLV